MAIRVFCAVWLFVMAFAGPGLAEPYPARGDPYLTDLAGVMAPDAAGRVRAALAELDMKTGIEMTVLTIPRRSDYDTADPLEVFARQVFDGWGLGSPQRNDGILVLVVTDERQVRLQLGAGYDQGFDPIAQDVVNRYFKPPFVTGDLSVGIEAGTMAAIADIAKRKAAAQTGAPAAPAGRGTGSGISIFLVAAASILALAGFRRRLRGNRPAPERNCLQCGRPMTSRSSETGTKSGSARALLCRRCITGEDREEDRRAPRPAASPRARDPADRDPADRDPADRGGRSDGGGASGRW